MEFIELSFFTSRIVELLAEDEYRELQRTLVVDPRAGDAIPAGRGLRKIRWLMRAKGRGKRSGVRVIYYYPGEDRIYMVYVYDKSRQGDLSRSQLKILASRMEGCR